MSNQYTVEYVEVESDKAPFEEFLEKLDEEVEAEILATIKNFQERLNHGLPPQKLSKKLRDDIFELRTTFVDGIARTLFFYMSGKRVIITHGFIKKTQKTPSKEITRAKNLRKEFMKKEEK